MARLPHGSATTTARTRADIQGSPEPAAALARRYGVNRKTVLKWRRREGVADLPMGPRERRSTVLSEVEEAAVVASRVQTRLPLDDVYAALRPSIPGLTRSSAHRALQRQGVSRLPRATRPRRGEFASYEVGYFHVDFAELRTAREKAYRFVAVDRTSEVAFARVYRRATSPVAAAFLKVLARGAPYRIHTALTDNGSQCGDAGGRRVYDRGHHPFGHVCRALGIEHRFTEPYHRWTNGQAERMVRALKEATVRAFHYESIRELRRHVADYLTAYNAAYNYARHLKALRWRTPVETLEALWASKAELFRRSPAHLTLGPNT